MIFESGKLKLGDIISNALEDIFRLAMGRRNTIAVSYRKNS